MFGIDKDFYDALTFSPEPGLRLALSKGKVLTIRMTQAFAKANGFLDRGEAVKVALAENPLDCSPNRRVIELRPVAAGGIAGRDPWGTKPGKAKTWAFNADHWVPLMTMKLPNFNMQDSSLSISKIKGDVTRIFIDLDAIEASEPFDLFDWDKQHAEIMAEEEAYQATKTDDEVEAQDARFKQFVEDISTGKRLYGPEDMSEDADVLDEADAKALRCIPEKYLMEELARRQAVRADAQASLREMAGLPPLQ